MKNKSEPFPMFDRYYTLEEAAGLIPVVKRALDKAHDELQEIQDQIVLYKRLYLAKEDETGEAPPGETQVLEQKCAEFEQAFNRWSNYFMEQGILLRDMEKGLIDFPYRASNGEVYLLCWHLGEDGIFYFHGTDTGFRGRQPITLLPE